MSVITAIEYKNGAVMKSYSPDRLHSKWFTAQNLRLFLVTYILLRLAIKRSSTFTYLLLYFIVLSILPLLLKNDNKA